MNLMEKPFQGDFEEENEFKFQEFRNENIQNLM